MTDTLVSRIDDIRKELKNYFDHHYKIEVQFHGNSHGDRITKEFWESIINVVLTRVYGEEYTSYTDQNLCYDGKVNGETLSYKGCLAKYAKTLKKHSLSITQYRTTRFIDIQDKIDFINKAINETKYEIVCIRVCEAGEYKFKVIAFEKSIFSIPINKKFIKKHETKNRRSKQRYFKCDLGNNIGMTISGSASDQLMIQIKNLDTFIKQSNAIILYDSMTSQKEMKNESN